MAGYIIEHYCLRVDTSVFRHVSCWDWLYYRPWLFESWHISVSWYVMLRLVILSTITVVCFIFDIYVCGLTYQWLELHGFMVLEYKLVILLRLILLILMTINVWGLARQRLELLSLVILSTFLSEGWHMRGSSCYRWSYCQHFYLRFGTWEVRAVTVGHIVNISIWGLAHERFELLPLVILSTLLSEVWHMRGSSCYRWSYCRHYCLRFDTSNVRVATVGHMIDIPIWCLAHPVFMWLVLYGFTILSVVTVVLLRLVIISISSIWNLADERYMLLRLFILSTLLFGVWKINSSCCYGW